ncbi:MAG: hypothetical protein IPL42_00175 [Saprospiraceae bacterium]|nr:hypothetical protein [Saprospiraceae bacterium]
MEKFNLRYLKPSAFIFICVVLGVALFAANKFINSHWGISVSVFAVIGGLFGIINSYGWNVRPFSYMYFVPDFSGRYEGTLLYEFRNEKCETVTDTLEHIKVIVQNGSDIVINSWTKKKDGTMSSKSTSIEASIVKEKDGTFSLLYNYLNEGNFKLGFCPHYGTEYMKLIENGNGKHLVGKHYTERMPFQTKGKLDLKFTSKQLYHEK